MDIQVDFQSSIPLYEQIAQRVLVLIENGEFQAGDQLPTTRELAVELGVNFNTVARAYRMLDQGCIITTQQGRGTRGTNITGRSRSKFPPHETGWPGHD